MSRRDTYSSADFASIYVPQDAYPITPNDDAPLPKRIRGIRATGAGDVVCMTASGAQRTLVFLAGETRYIAVSRVYATGTTATGLEGLV